MYQQVWGRIKSVWAPLFNFVSFQDEDLTATKWLATFKYFISDSGENGTQNPSTKTSIWCPLRLTLSSTSVILVKCGYWLAKRVTRITQWLCMSKYMSQLTHYTSKVLPKWIQEHNNEKGISIFVPWNNPHYKLAFSYFLSKMSSIVNTITLKILSIKFLPSQR